MISNPYSSIEMMIIAASREIRDGEVVFMGTYWPILAVNTAQRTSAPNISVAVEGGMIFSSPPSRIPLVAGDLTLSGNSELCGDTFDTLGMLLHAGRVDITLLSAAMVDKYGNINTTCIGSYLEPKVRFAGSGGASDLACLSKRFVVMLEHDKRRFPERVDFITTPGYLDGNNSRQEAGLPEESGPSAVVSTMGVFRFEKESKEMTLTEYFPGVEIETIRKNMGWELKVDDAVKETKPPSEEELRVLRVDVDPEGMFLKDERAR